MANMMVPIEILIYPNSKEIKLANPFNSYINQFHFRVLDALVNCAKHNVFVFATFRASLLADNQSIALYNSSFIFLTLLVLLKLQYNVVSSAYISI